MKSVLLPQAGLVFLILTLPGLPLNETSVWAQQEIAVTCEELASRCPVAVIADIRIDHREIFESSDPLPGWFPYQTVNHLHINTAESTIRSNLLFHVGERLDVERVRETQRKLNALGYFQKEEMTCEEVAAGEVRVEVHLKENWSLIPILDFQGQGGGTAVTAGFSEQNLLGRGKILSFSYRKGAEEGNTIIEDAWRLSYEDPNLLNSEYRLFGLIEERESGQTLVANFEKPYFSLETPWAVALSNSFLERTAYLYQSGGIAADYNQRYDAAEMDLGFALKRGPPVVHRVRALYHFENQTIRRFRPFSPDSPPRPPDYTYSYPAIGYRRLGVDYIRERRVDRFERDEYFNIGNDFQISAGFSAELLGASRDEWLLSSSDTQGYRFREGHFFLASATADGFLDGDRVRNGVATVTYDHYLQETLLDAGPFRHTLHAEAALAYGKNLDSDQVLGLGYTNGLRGYDYYAFTGSKLFRMSLEDRIFVKQQLLGLLSLGLLVFADTGYVWQPAEDPDLSDLRYDVGLGLRTAVPSASGANVVRLDWGFPVGSGASPLEDVIFTVSVGSTFD